jgi:hypothetical protein
MSQSLSGITILDYREFVVGSWVGKDGDGNPAIKCIFAFYENNGLSCNDPKFESENGQLCSARMGVQNVVTEIEVSVAVGSNHDSSQEETWK